MNNEVIVALDFPGKEQALEFLDKFDKPLYVKVGMELFYKEGPDIIREIKARGNKIFLDLKLHDIPNTVCSSMKVLSELGVNMINVHAAGTKRMMEAAMEGLGGADNPDRPLLIAVTQLTSTDQETMENDLLIMERMEDVVLKYAGNARDAGLDGVVCSALEAPLIHRRMGENFITVTPGIRFAGDVKGDQKRVVTPGRAGKLGADYIVVGRSITKAENPKEAYERCIREFI